jgi:hypothetical protein
MAALVNGGSKPDKVFKDKDVNVVVTPSVLPRVNASKLSMRIFFLCFV